MNAPPGDLRGLRFWKMAQQRATHGRGPEARKKKEEEEACQVAGCEETQEAEKGRPSIKLVLPRDACPGVPI